MAGRGELTDEVWERIRPLLPGNGRRGRQWRDHRTVVNGILWRLRTGARRRHVPKRYGPWQTRYDRFVRWRQDGTWERLLARVQTGADVAEEIEWTVSIDSTIAKAHQHSAGARRLPGQKGIEHPNDEGLGRSRGGLTTKIHVACDGKERLLSIVVTSGQTHESSQLAAVLDAISVPRRTVGRPRKRPDLLIADRGYSYPSSRRLLRSRKIPHMIPERSDQRERRFGRPPVFDADVYARRNVAERCVNKLKQWRGIATRYEKRALNYRAVVVIAALMTRLAM